MGTWINFLNALLSGNMWGLRIRQDDIEHLAKMCFLSLEDAEACTEHHMGICQRRGQVQ